MSTISQQLVQAEADLRAARDRVNDLRALEFEQVREPEMRNLIGSYWKYRNCYSCPSKDSDYWWMYAKVVGVRGGSFRMLTFQRDSYGKLQIQEESYPSLDGKWQQIDGDAFDAEVVPLLDSILAEVTHCVPASHPGASQ